MRVHDDGEMRYRGVEQVKGGKFRAFVERHGERKTLGLYNSPREAAEAVDEERVAKKGILFAFDRLNLKTPMRCAEYDAAVAALREERRQEAEYKMEVLRKTPIPPESYSMLLDRSRLGVSIVSLAAEFGTAEEVVVATLRRLEQERLANLGLGI